MEKYCFVRSSALDNHTIYKRKKILEKPFNVLSYLVFLLICHIWGQNSRFISDIKVRYELLKFINIFK